MKKAWQEQNVRNSLLFSLLESDFWLYKTWKEEGLAAEANVLALASLAEYSVGVQFSSLNFPLGTADWVSNTFHEITMEVSDLVITLYVNLIIS